MGSVYSSLRRRSGQPLPVLPPQGCREVEWGRLAWGCFALWTEWHDMSALQKQPSPMLAAPPLWGAWCFLRLALSSSRAFPESSLRERPGFLLCGVGRGPSSSFLGPYKLSILSARLSGPEPRAVLSPLRTGLSSSQLF